MVPANHHGHAIGATSPGKTVSVQVLGEGFSRAGLPQIASAVLARIADLYAIQTKIRGRSAYKRRAVREDRSRLIVDDLEPWLRAKLALISQTTKLTEAIRFALSPETDL